MPTARQRERWILWDMQHLLNLNTSRHAAAYTRTRTRMGTVTLRPTPYCKQAHLRQHPQAAVPALFSSVQEARKPLAWQKKSRHQGVHGIGRNWVTMSGTRSGAIILIGLFLDQRRAELEVDRALDRGALVIAH